MQTLPLCCLLPLGKPASSTGRAPDLLQRPSEISQTKLLRFILFETVSKPAGFKVMIRDEPRLRRIPAVSACLTQALVSLAEAPQAGVRATYRG
jgi:hypothetical protein